MTYRQIIIEELLNGEQKSCQELTQKVREYNPSGNKKLVVETHKTKDYLSGSISSLLQVMVKQGLISILDIKTKRGGKIYVLTSST